jgi:hypothetical protein
LATPAVLEAMPARQACRATMLGSISPGPAMACLDFARPATIKNSNASTGGVPSLYIEPVRCAGQRIFREIA